jgi:hypothetical protein
MTDYISDGNLVERNDEIRYSAHAARRVTTRFAIVVAEKKRFKPRYTEAAVENPKD